MTKFLGLLYSHYIYQMINPQTSKLYLHYYQLHIRLFNIIGSIYNLVGPYIQGNSYQTFSLHYYVLFEYN